MFAQYVDASLNSLNSEVEASKPEVKLSSGPKIPFEEDEIHDSPSVLLDCPNVGSQFLQKKQNKMKNNGNSNKIIP